MEEKNPMITPTLKRKLFPAAIIMVAAVVSYFAWATLRPSAPGEGFVRGNGRIETIEIDVATKLAGRVQGISVNEGDFLQTGQPLAQMQIDVLEPRREKARAQDRQSSNAVRSANAQVPQRKSDKAVAEAVVAQRESEFYAARRSLARSEELAKSKVISAQAGFIQRARDAGKEKI
jgi:HlyD family secretion protein